jgi:hypothetical protein
MTEGVAEDRGAGKAEFAQRVLTHGFVIPK